MVAAITSFKLSSGITVSTLRKGPVKEGIRISFDFNKGMASFINFALFSAGNMVIILSFLITEFLI